MNSPSFSEPVFPDPPRKNDALFLYGARRALPFVFSYIQQSVEIVYGPACNPDNEIYLQECQQDGVSVFKRRSGGGTVVLSPGMVVTIVVDRPQSAQSPVEIFAGIHTAMIGLLDAYGVKNIKKTGISDLAINGKKIMGSSLYLKHSPKLYFYQSALMVDSNLSLLSKYLRHPPREPEYRQKRSHEDFCTTLKNQGYRFTAEKIAGIFGQDLAGKLGL